MSVSSFPQLQFPSEEDWKTYKDAEASGVDCSPDERAPMPVLSIDSVEPADDAYFPGDQKRPSGRQEAKTRHKTRRPGRKKGRNGQHRPGLSVPVERIREPLEAWLAQPENTTMVLAARIGFSPRRLYSVLRSQTAVTVNVADKVLCAIDRTDLWYAEAKYGGLRDIYFHKAVVGEAS